MTSSQACRFCRAPLTRSFVDLGMTPLANSYLEKDEVTGEEHRYPLHARVCDDCLLVQVEAVVPPEAIFSDYAYFSSYSDSWVEHARRFAHEAVDRLGLGPDSLVVEVASNDGYLLRHFRDLDVPVLGIEPAANVAAVAREAGIPTDVRFFGAGVARELADRGSQADLVVANNVLAHVPDLGDFVDGLAELLKPGGVASVEVPHLLQLIRHVQFDTIYHEHLSYFSLITLERVFAASKMDIFDVEELGTHGGSLRIWAGETGRRRPSSRLLAVREAERRAGLDDATAYEGFEAKVRRCRASVLAFLEQAMTDGQTVVAYGAAAKGNTLLNYCGIGREQIAYVVDRSPHKQGRFLPGSHLAIEHPARVVETKPDFLVLLPWNLREELTRQMAALRDWGGRFVTFIPEVSVF